MLKMFQMLEPIPIDDLGLVRLEGEIKPKQAY